MTLLGPHDPDNAPPAFDRTGRIGRGGSIAMVLFLAVLLAGAAAGYVYIGREKAEPYALFILGCPTTLAAFRLFMLAAGILHFGPRAGGCPLLKATADRCSHAVPNPHA